MSETIQDTQLVIETFILESFPTADIAPGTVLSELVTKLAATLQNPIKNSITDLNQGNSISSAIESVTDTYNPIIDGIASNYNMSRGEGSKSVGKIKVIITDNSTNFLPIGFKFFQPVVKLNYVVTEEYRITTAPVNANDIALLPEGALWYFVVPVVAENIGSEYQISANAKFSLDSSNLLTGFVDAYAYGNFTTGLPIETDKVLIAKLQAGLTNKTLLTSKSILARLQDLYPSVRDLSVVGSNDAEMTRNKHNLFSISTLGMADVYIRTSLGPETIQITKTATQTDNVWSFSLGVDDYPGFYRIISILPTAQELTGTLVSTPVYGYSTGGITPSNLITNNQEGRFTKYQTCEVSFTYDSDETEADFDVVLSYQPDLVAIQDHLLSDEERIACADYLVKAALPCFVSVGLKLHSNNPNVALPIDKIKQDIYNYINTIPFGDSLYVSKLIDICHNYDVRYVEFPIQLSGDILADDGSIVTITSTDTLTIPTNLNIGISPKTTLFFADYYKSGASDLHNQNLLTDSIGVEVV